MASKLVTAGLADRQESPQEGRMEMVVGVEKDRVCTGRLDGDNLSCLLCLWKMFNMMTLLNSCAE